jgi:hypothetical protein
MEKENSKYIKGFNHAYLLAKYKSQLIESILNTTSISDYIQGLKDGKRTYEQQKIKSRSKELKDLKTYKSINNDLDLEL